MNYINEGNVSNEFFQLQIVSEIVKWAESAIDRTLNTLIDKRSFRSIIISSISTIRSLEDNNSKLFLPLGSVHPDDEKMFRTEIGAKYYCAQQNNCIEPVYNNFWERNETLFVENVAWHSSGYQFFLTDQLPTEWTRRKEHMDLNKTRVSAHRSWNFNPIIQRKWVSIVSRRRR